MTSRPLILALALVPFLAGGALAAERLTDRQLDKVTAGEGFNPPIIPSVPDFTLPPATCDGCTVLVETNDGSSAPLAFTGDIAGFLQGYYQHLVDKGYLNR